MNLDANKQDAIPKAISQTTVAAVEYNQIAGSLMNIQNEAGLTADENDNTQITKAVNLLAAKAAMPSNIYDDLILGASGTFYTASSNGYLSLNKRTGSTGFIWISIEIYDTNDTLIYTMEESRYQDSTANLSFLVPMQKNYKAKISYNATGTTEAFRFIYAEGCKQEAQ